MGQLQNCQNPQPYSPRPQSQPGQDRPECRIQRIQEIQDNQAQVERALAMKGDVKNIEKNSKADPFLARQQQFIKNREAKLASKKKIKENSQEQNCTFKPKILKQQKQARESKIYQRQRSSNLKKQQRIEHLRLELRQEQLKNCKKTARSYIQKDTSRSNNSREGNRSFITRKSDYKTSRFKEQPVVRKLTPQRTKNLVERLSSSRKVVRKLQDSFQKFSPSKKSKHLALQRLKKQVTKALKKFMAPGKEEINYTMFCQLVSELKFVDESLTPDRSSRDRSLMAEAWHLVERNGVCPVQSFREMVYNFMGFEVEQQPLSSLKLRQESFISNKSVERSPPTFSSQDFKVFYHNRLNSDFSKSTISVKREDSFEVDEQFKIRQTKRHEKMVISHDELVLQKADDLGICYKTDSAGDRVVLGQLERQVHLLSRERANQQKMRRQVDTLQKPAKRKISIVHKPKAIRQQNSMESTGLKSTEKAVKLVLDLRLNETKFVKVEVFEGETVEDVVQRVQLEHSLPQQKANRFRQHLIKSQSM